MLTARIIPCLDVKGGRVVKGVRFKNLRDAGDPAELACAYEEQGADELVLLDVSATPDGRKTQLDWVRRVRAGISIPLSVGGGVRDLDDAAALLQAGADKVGINTAAVRDPKLLERMAATFGSQCTILALDAARNQNGSWDVVVRSGTKRLELDAVEWARTAAARGAGEILLTSWDRDGTRKGYDLDLLGAISQAVRVPLIASGGAATPGHLLEALHAGADAVLAASIFHYGECTVGALKEFIRANQVEVRT
jgi:cyclase